MAKVIHFRFEVEDEVDLSLLAMHINFNLLGLSEYEKSVRLSCSEYPEIMRLDVSTDKASNPEETFAAIRIALDTISERRKVDLSKNNSSTHGGSGRIDNSPGNDSKR